MCSITVAGWQNTLNKDGSELMKSVIKDQSCKCLSSKPYTCICMKSSWTVNICKYCSGSLCQPNMYRKSDKLHTEVDALEDCVGCRMVILSYNEPTSWEKHYYLDFYATVTSGLKFFFKLLNYLRVIFNIVISDSLHKSWDSPLLQSLYQVFLQHFIWLYFSLCDWCLPNPLWLQWGNT